MRTFILPNVNLCFNLKKKGPIMQQQLILTKCEVTLMMMMVGDHREARDHQGCVQSMQEYHEKNLQRNRKYIHANWLLHALCSAC